MVSSFGSLAGYENLDLTDMQAVSGLIQQFSGLLYGATDILADLIFAYCPALNRDDIMDDVYDDELIDAFVKILRVAIPLDKLREMFAGLSNPATS